MRAIWAILLLLKYTPTFWTYSTTNVTTICNRSRHTFLTVAFVTNPSCERFVDNAHKMHLSQIAEHGT